MSTTDFMDGTYLSGHEVQQVLAISRQRLHQLVQAGRITPVMTPLGPLFLSSEVAARVQEIQGLRRLRLLLPEVCSGKSGPHPLTEGNVWYGQAQRVWRCKACIRHQIDRWRQANPERWRENNRKAVQKYQQRKREAATPGAGSAGEA